jgi:hypothetical protein
MKRRSSDTLRRILQLENLEQRALLAGNITAAVTDGVLKVSGDDAPNGVIVRAVPPPAGSDPNNPPPLKLEIVGIKSPDGVATTVNGGTTSFIAEGVTKVVIDLGKGDDGLTIVNPPPKPVEGQPPPPPAPPVPLPGDARIFLGDGNDRFGGSVANKASLMIAGGAGNDGIALWGSNVNNVQLFGDAPPPPPGTNVTPPPPGSDRVDFTNSHAAGTALIDMAGGDNVVMVQGRTKFDKGLNINTGDGKDGVQILGVPAKDGKPPIDVIIQGGMQINLGGGDDKANLAGLWVPGVVSVNAGAGADDVNFTHVGARDSLFADLGADNDKLTVANNYSKSAQFHGGDGADLYTDAGGNQFAALTMDGFEDPT